jgi:hypothetical protein
MAINDLVRSAISIQGTSIDGFKKEMKGKAISYLTQNKVGDQTAKETAETDVENAAKQARTSSDYVFSAPQPLITATFSAGTVTAIWGLSKLLLPNLSFIAGPWYPFIWTLLLGTAYYFFDVTDPLSEKNGRSKIIKAFIAFLNCLLLTAAVLGVVNTSSMFFK